MPPRRALPGLLPPTSPAPALEIQLRDWAMGPVFHQYLALRAVSRDGAGQPVEDRSLAEIHGFATRASAPDPARINPLELGRGAHLHAYRFEGARLAGRLNQVIASSAGSPPAWDAETLRITFDAAFADADAEFNAMGLRYRLARQNSNTVARWVTDRILHRLGLERPVRPGLLLRRPGWNNRLRRPVLGPAGRAIPEEGSTGA